jgi:hypothetical protein
LGNTPAIDPALLDELERSSCRVVDPRQLVRSRRSCGLDEFMYGVLRRSLHGSTLAFNAWPRLAQPVTGAMPIIARYAAAGTPASVQLAGERVESRNGC